MIHVYYLTQSQYWLKNMLQGMVHMLLEKIPLKKYTAREKKNGANKSPQKKTEFLNRL